MKNNISMDQLRGLYQSGEISTDQLTDYIERLQGSAKMSNLTLHSQIIAIKAAAIAGRTHGPQVGMQWLENYLFGPGLLPTEEEEALGAQGFLDAQGEQCQGVKG